MTMPVPALPVALSGERRELAGVAGRLSYYMAGPDAPSSEPPLLLIHSVNAAASAYEVKPLYEHYRATRPVYALDLPGYGFSERSARFYSPRLMTDALHAVTDEIAARHGALSAYLFSADITRVYLGIPVPVWLAHGTRGDFTDYRYAPVIAKAADWTIHVMQTGALPYFEDLRGFASAYDRFLHEHVAAR